MPGPTARATAETKSLPFAIGRLIFSNHVSCPQVTGMGGLSTDSGLFGRREGPTRHGLAHRRRKRRIDALDCPPQDLVQLELIYPIVFAEIHRGGARRPIGFRRVAGV